MTVPVVRHLALDGGEAAREGVEVDPRGVARLALAPGVPHPLAQSPQELLGGPATVAVGAGGDVWTVDAAAATVVRWRCDGSAQPLRCLRPGSVPALVAPRGVAVGPDGVLWVSDAGAHRILGIDVASEQIVAVLGAGDLYGEPERSARPGGFDDPRDLAVDAAGALYVVDAGNARIQRLRPGHGPDAGFAAAIAAGAPVRPEWVAVALIDGEERVLVLDAGESPPRLRVYETGGAPDDAASARLAAGLGDTLARAGALAAGGGRLYVGDPARGRLLQFELAGGYAGEVPLAPATSAIAFDAAGRLVIAGDGALLAAELGARRAAQGLVLLGPLAVAARAAGSLRVRATLAEPLPEGAHLQLHVLGCGAADAPPAPPPPGLAPGGEGPTPRGTWRAAPLDAPDMLADLEPAEQAWVAVRLSGDGAATPAVAGLALVENETTWLSRLPAVYAREDDGALRRLLVLLESALLDEEELLEGIPRLLDPAGTPDAWLDWLGDLVAAELDATWPEATRRDAVAGAFERHGRRGTAGALRELARLHTGADILISEPAATASLWTLGGGELGISSGLAPAAADGAVAGTSAVLGASHVQDDDDAGRPLYDDLAHRFCVEAYARDLARPGAREALERLLERERPAHTRHALCVIDARMRVGFQARVGVDAVVAGPPDPPRSTRPPAVGSARLNSHLTIT